MSETDKLVERLRKGIAEIMAGLAAGTVGGDDVVWFSEIETLWEYCAQLLDPENVAEFDLECSDPDALLASMGGKDDLQTISNPQCADLQAGRSPSAGVSGAEGATKPMSLEETAERLRALFMAVQRNKRSGSLDSKPISGIVNLTPTVLYHLHQMAEFERDLVGEAAQSSGARSLSPSEASAATAGLDEQSSPANVSGEGEP